MNEAFIPTRLLVLDSGERRPPLTSAERDSLRGWADKYVQNAAYCLKHQINVGKPLSS